MRSWGLAAAFLSVLYLASPAAAWNNTGHRIVAAVAYERLTPKVRARVDELIRRHPDYALLTKDAPADPALRARDAFIAAATWPDIIRSDNRFYDDAQKDAVPTPVLPGFPDMKRHLNWHYYDIPYAPDGAPVEKAESPNALTELRRIVRKMAPAPREMDSIQVVYDLPWLEHLTGDVHQPLHTTSRFLKSQAKGDAGGNFVIVEPNRTLHSVWDGAPGDDSSDDYVMRYAHEVLAEHPEPRRISRDPEDWIKESYRYLKTDVYTFGLETGSREHPLPLPSGYEENAKRLARQRIATAGYRLASVLNSRLK